VYLGYRDGKATENTLGLFFLLYLSCVLLGSKHLVLLVGS
jgi:hypothetical protein